MAAERPIVHIRLPARSDAVSGQEQQPGISLVANGPSDRRTVSQDPILKTKLKQPGGVGQDGR